MKAFAQATEPHPQRAANRSERVGEITLPAGGILREDGVFMQSVEDPQLRDVDVLVVVHVDDLLGT
jgi:hypothetical protein